jgi:hypothetical protein
MAIREHFKKLNKLNFTFYESGNIATVCLFLNVMFGTNQLLSLVNVVQCFNGVFSQLGTHLVKHSELLKQIFSRHGTVQNQLFVVGMLILSVM